MNNVRVSLKFMRSSDAELVAFTDNVAAKLTGNDSFATPIVSIPTLTKASGVFSDAIGAAAFGDRQAIAARVNARNALLGLLRQLAAYVQSVAADDQAVLLSSGFEPVQPSSGSSPLPKAVIDKISNDQSTKLTVRLQAIDNARAYEVRMSFGANGMQVVGTFTSSRGILLEDLTPGTIYTIQARAIGGSTGYGDWSDPSSHMAT
jgi:hypothetical protein